MRCRHCGSAPVGGHRLPLFPDVVPLGEAVTDPVALYAKSKPPVAKSRDVVAQMAFGSDFSLREVLGYQVAVQSVITMPLYVAARPGGVSDSSTRPSPLADTARVPKPPPRCERWPSCGPTLPLS